MKILHSYKVYLPEIDGGIPSAVAALTEPSDPNIEDEILVARKRGMAKSYRIGGVPVTAVTSLGTVFSTPLAPTFPYELLRRARTADIVVHHAPFPIADLALSRLPDRVGLIVYWHADIVRYSLLRAVFVPSILRTLQRADQIIVSDAFNITSSDILSQFADKCTAVPFGINVEIWSNCDAAEQKLANDLRGRYPRMIVSLGRLVSYKGLSVLLKAMTELDAQLVLIGDGALLGDLQRQTGELGLSDRVTFAGRLTNSEIKSYLHSAKALAFPSISSAEAFGIVQLEAMAAGLPIVNTALETAVPRIARHELEALTVPPDDAVALAAALSRILNDPAVARRLGEGGQQRARTEYSHRNYILRVRGIYEQVIRDRVRGSDSPLEG